jgi:hypothetical protein
MADSFRIKEDRDYYKTQLRKQVRDRTKECYVPRCWELKDKKDKGAIYLHRKITKPPRHVQLRRLLFLRAWDEVPDGHRLTMRCGNDRCINPTHATYPGFWPHADIVHKLIDKMWLTDEEAKDWFFTYEV